MRRRAALLSVVVLAFAPSAARAANMRVDAPVKAGYLELPGPAYAVDGVTSGSLHGAASWSETGSGNSFSGRFTYADARGTLRGTSKGEQQAPAGTSIAFTETITITGGTGAYNGAHGTLSSPGSADTQTGDITRRLKGKLTTGHPTAPPPPIKRAAPYHASMSIIAATTGSVVTAVGTVHGLTPPGGLIVLHSPQGANTVTESFTYYDGLGSISGTFQLVRTPQPDGTLKLSGRTGGTAHGTGRYAHVSGLGATSFNGQRDASTGDVTIQLSGRLAFSH